MCSVYSLLAGGTFVFFARGDFACLVEILYRIEGKNGVFVGIYIL